MDILQIEDLKRHNRSTLHMSSLAALQLAATAKEPDREHEKIDQTVPTVAQVQRALDTLHNNTRSGHGNLYSQECGRSRVSDPINFPLGRSTAKEFGKIIQAAAFVEMASDRVRFKQAVAAGWAEARCPSQPKFQQSLVLGPVALSICLDTRTGCER